MDFPYRRGSHFFEQPLKLENGKGRRGVTLLQNRFLLHFLWDLQFFI